MDDTIKLTRRLRRLEVLCCALVIGCTTVTLTGSESPSPKAITAERFQMLDAEGRVRGYWRMTDDGSPAFTLYDSEGKSRIALFAAPAGASEVCVSNAAGQSTRVRIEADGAVSGVPAAH